MAVIVNGDGILTGISSLATALTDITSGRGTITGVTTVGTLQLGAGVSISSPRSQQAAIFTNNTEFLTVDDAGRVGVGTITPNSDVHPQNVGKINVGFITARSVAGDIDANTMVVAGISTFAERTIFENNLTITSGTLTMSTAGNIVLGDSGSASDDRITFGAVADFQVYHDGSNNFLLSENNHDIIARAGTGDVYLQGSDVFLGTVGHAKKFLEAHEDGAVELYHNNVKLFETTSGGCTSTIAGANTFTIGSSDASGAYLVLDGDSNGDGSGSDYCAIIHGTDGDLSIHADNPSGDAQFELYTGSGATTAIVAQAAGEVQLYHNGSQKLVTLAGGAEVFGSLITENSGAGSGTSEIQLQPYGTDGYINCTASGNLYTRMGASFAIRTRIDSSGNFYVNSGNIVIGTSGKGIDFSATTDAGGTSTATVLEDYEEGSYTITSNTNLTMDNQRTGYYTKIGNLVNVIGYLSLNTNDGSPSVSGTNGIVLSLPYARDTSTAAYTGTMLQQNINSDSPESLVGHPLWYKVLPVDYVCMAASDGLRFYINKIEAAYTRMNNSHLHVGYPGYTYIVWNITYRTN